MATLSVQFCDENLTSSFSLIGKISQLTVSVGVVHKILGPFCSSQPRTQVPPPPPSLPTTWTWTQNGTFRFLVPFTRREVQSDDDGVDVNLWYNGSSTTEGIEIIDLMQHDFKRDRNRYG